MGTDAYADTFANYALHVVTHFKDRVHCWEVWNEETGIWFWPNPSPVPYGRLLVKTEYAIHQANPTDLVIFFTTPLSSTIS